MECGLNKYGFKVCKFLFKVRCLVWPALVSILIVFAPDRLNVQRIPGQPPLPIYRPGTDDEGEEESATEGGDDAATQSETAVGSAHSDGE